LWAAAQGAGGFPSKTNRYIGPYPPDGPLDIAELGKYAEVVRASGARAD